MSNSDNKSSLVQKLWSALKGPDAPVETLDSDRKKIALTLVLFEIASSDNDLQPAEHDVILRVLETCFSLSMTEISELIGEATSRKIGNFDLYQNVRELSASLSYIDRLDIAKAVCIISLADGVVVDMEERLVASITSLLKIRSSDLDDIKTSAKRFLDTE